jgi:tetratricopeptide (TPR) repeat protein
VAERYAVAAELGRAWFHLGDYSTAYAFLARAAALEPRRIETALYLEASAFLTGRRRQALAIFEEVVRSGAPDLYLAVTLPGERSFLADPEVRHARPISMSLHHGTFEGIRPGQQRRSVEDALGVRSPDPSSPTLVARAGPEMIWAFRFSQAGTLEEIAVRAELLLRYTPYRLRFAGGLDWSLGPEQAIAELGPAGSTTTAEGSLALAWDLPDLSLSLVFGRPTGPVPPTLGGDHLVLQLVRIRRQG